MVFLLLWVLAAQRAALAAAAAVAAILASGGELAELVADHRLGDEHRHMLASIVHRDGVANHVREDVAAPRPGLDDLLLPGGVKDLVLCTEKGDGPVYTRVKDQEVNCRDPAGTPVTPEERKAKEKADDEDSDALIKKMQQESIEMLKRMQQQQKQQ